MIDEKRLAEMRTPPYIFDNNLWYEITGTLEALWKVARAAENFNMPGTDPRLSELQKAFDHLYALKSESRP
jgi:hypothetical protein